MANIFVRFFGDPKKDPVFRWQWGRLKRRQQMFWFLVAILGALHVASWIVWIFWVAPFPYTIHPPLALGDFFLIELVWDYLWLILLGLTLGINIALAWFANKKDLFLGWLLLGVSFLLQIIALGVVVTLIFV